MECVMAKRRLGVWVVSLAALAAGAACHATAGSNPSVADAAARETAFEATATSSPLDAADAEVSNAILAIPGLSVWLDPGTGVSQTPAGVETWTDRSVMKHVFIAQTVTDALPKLGVVAGQLGLVFDGRNRALVEGAPSAAQQDSLTFTAGGFAVAIVFCPSESPPERTVLAALQGPWLGSLSANVPPPEPPGPLYLTLDSAGLNAQVATQNFRLDVPAAERTSAHLFVLSLVGEHITIRIDGHASLDAQGAFSGNVPRFEYAPLYIADWDFDSQGFSGAVGDVMIVKGTAAATSIEAIERYLLQKYAI
jgi:hypothetical protein